MSRNRPMTKTLKPRCLGHCPVNASTLYTSYKQLPFPSQYHLPSRTHTTMVKPIATVHSDALALLVPMSKAADEMLRLRANRHRLADRDAIQQMDSFTKPLGKRIAMLDIAALRGQCCFSFGYSHSHVFRIPRTTSRQASMSTAYFTISVDRYSGQLYILPQSNMQLRRASMQDFQNIYSGVFALKNDTRIRFDHKEFRIVLTDTRAILPLLEAHFKRIDQMWCSR